MDVSWESSKKTLCQYSLTTRFEQFPQKSKLSMAFFNVSKDVIKVSFQRFKYNCDALHDLVPFAQFKKRKKHHRGVLLLVKLQAEALDL